LKSVFVLVSLLVLPACGGGQNGAGGTPNYDILHDRKGPVNMAYHGVARVGKEIGRMFKKR
jgi:hypothetical protein